MALGVLAALGVGVLGQRLVGLLRRLNIRLSDFASSRSEVADASGVTKAVALGLAARFACGAGLAALGLGILVPALRAAPLSDVRGAFPTVLWAGPIAAATIAARPRAGLDRALLAAGFVVGWLVLRKGL